MMSARWRRIALVSLAVTAVSMLVAYEFAGPFGALGVVAYLGGVLAPGAGLYAVLSGRFRAQPSNLLELVFYSNLLGFAEVEGVGWVLARSGWFSLPALLGLEAGIVILVALAFRAHLGRAWRRPDNPVLTVTSDEVAYLGITIVVVCLMLAPLLTLFSNGFFVGTDTGPYTRAGWVVAQTGSWPSLDRILWPHASPAAMAPGAPMVFALFAAVTGVWSPPMATVIDIIPLTLAPLGLCLLVRRYSSHALLTYGLPLVWLVGTSDYTGLLYNNTLTSIYTGSHPDAILALPFLIAVFLLVTKMAQEKTALWFETVLLAAAVLASVLASQLSFIFVVLALLFFGVGILWTRGWRWALPRLGIVLGPIVVAWPLYLLPQNVILASPGTANGSVWNPTEWGINWSLLFGSTGLLAEICAVVFALAILADLYDRFRERAIGFRGSRSTGLYAFTGIALVALFLAYTNLPEVAFGVAPIRFLTFASVATLPVLAFGCDRFFHLKLPSRGVAPTRARRRGRAWQVLSAVAVAALLVYSGVTSLDTGSSIQAKSADSANLVTPSALAAAQWLKEEAPATAVIAIDANGGNVGAVAAIGIYSGHEYVVRLRYLLHNALHLPPPQNTSYDYMNRVMTDPTAANAALAATLGIDYYVFQDGFSSRQITAFSLLPYFSLVYSNNHVDVFQYVGGTSIGFVPAVSYCSASEGIVTEFSLLAYAYAATTPPFPKTPNWVTSTSSYPPGSLYASYCLNVPTSGNYTLYVHRDAFGVTQFINVSTGEGVVGQVYFLDRGLTLGTPLPLTLPAGPLTLTLSFQGGGGPLNPVDYLILAPD